MTIIYWLLKKLLIFNWTDRKKMKRDKEKERNEKNRQVETGPSRIFIIIIDRMNRQSMPFELDTPRRSVWHDLTNGCFTIKRKWSEHDELIFGLQGAAKETERVIRGVAGGGVKYLLKGGKGDWKGTEETLLRQRNTSREVLLVSPRPEAMTAIVRN